MLQLKLKKMNKLNLLIKKMEILTLYLQVKIMNINVTLKVKKKKIKLSQKILLKVKNN